MEKELDPSSVELMARALEKCDVVYKDKDLLKKMRKTAMVASQEFTWGNASLQYESVAEEIRAVGVLPLCSDNTAMLETDKVVASRGWRPAGT